MDDGCDAPSALYTGRPAIWQKKRHCRNRQSIGRIVHTLPVRSATPSLVFVYLRQSPPDGASRPSPQPALSTCHWSRCHFSSPEFHDHLTILQFTHQEMVQKYELRIYKARTTICRSSTMLSPRIILRGLRLRSYCMHAKSNRVLFVR